MGETRNSGFGMRESIRTVLAKNRVAHATTEGRSIDRSLVQVKHSRSSGDVGCGIAQPAKAVAQQAMCAALVHRPPGPVRQWRAWKTKPHAGSVGRLPCSGRTAPGWRAVADAIADPMKLVYLPEAFAAAGLVRNRLHGRPLVNRATQTNDTRRSSYR